MENLSSYSEILKNIDATNAREKLTLIKQSSETRELLLFNQAIDVIYISNNELLLITCDFIDKSEGTDWLADENSYPNEPPLYFSECSHRYSPVYKLNRTKLFLSRFFPESLYRINCLLFCNYNIINYDDMETKWKEMGITVVHRFPKKTVLFQTPKELPLAEDPTITDDEFDRLLEEFIKDTQDENQSTNDTSIEDFSSDEIHIEKIQAYRNFKQTCGNIQIPDTTNAYTTFNVHQLSQILILIQFRNECIQTNPLPFHFKLYNKAGLNILQGNAFTRQVTTDDEQETQISFILEKTVWEEGMYLFELKIHNKTLTTVTFYVGQKNQKGNLFQSKESTSNALEQLDRMIGLQEVKDQMNRYKNMVQLVQRRKACGFETQTPPLHAAFLGNPGTGKTTVAKLYGKMLKEQGLLSKGHVVIESRSTLMGQNYASEQEKTLAALEKARGGVLFIDEAYLLYKPEDPRDPGQNVLDTLLTVMGDESKKDWALLLAGYTTEMTTMLTYNPGFQSRIPQQNRYFFADYSVDELMQIAENYCKNNNYILSPDARKALKNKITRDFRRKERNFGNGRYLIHLLQNEILQAMSDRLEHIHAPNLLQLMTIEKSDIPSFRPRNYEKPLKKLHRLVGLNQLKSSIESHLNLVKFTVLRNEQGLTSEFPPQHMVFTGNPGTGKTTVADLMGEIYASLGLLSVGQVIRVERKDLIGAHVGETEQKTAKILKRAEGNVLFIDEAYTLCNDSSADYGRRVLEMLLQPLANPHIDMLVILAGYPKEMEKLFQANTGLKSRFPNTFYFEDYTVNELLEIAKDAAQTRNYHFTPAALKALRLLVEEQLNRHDAHWGNARSVIQLLTNSILPRMSARLLQMPAHKQTDKKALSTICLSDIPTSIDLLQNQEENIIDETAVEEILQSLDHLVGLETIKQNIHHFVRTVRHLAAARQSYTDCFSLRWNFTGNTGTGKSTIAGIMGKLLKALNILEEGHLTELKAEEFYTLPEYQADEMLKSALIRSRQGILFVDGDAPGLQSSPVAFNSERLRCKLSSLMTGLPGHYALVIASQKTSDNRLTQSLHQTGETDFNHTFHFPDYTNKELQQILVQCLVKKDLYLSPEATRHINTYIDGLCTRRDLGYANARTMSIIADAIAENYWANVPKQKNKRHEISREHVISFVWNNLPGERTVGYIQK